MASLGGIPSSLALLRSCVQKRFLQEGAFLSDGTNPRQREEDGRRSEATLLLFLSSSPCKDAGHGLDNPEELGMEGDEVHMKWGVNTVSKPFTSRKWFWNGVVTTLATLLPACFSHGESNALFSMLGWLEAMTTACPTMTLLPWT